MVNERRAICTGDGRVVVSLIKGVAVACFSAGLIVAMLVGSAAMMWLQMEPIDGCVNDDLALRRPELFREVNDMPRKKRTVVSRSGDDLVAIEWTGTGHMNKAAVMQAFGYKMPFCRVGPGFRTELTRSEAESLIEAVPLFKLVGSTPGDHDEPVEPIEGGE